MKLKSLDISEFKNIGGITIDFSTYNGFTLIIGNNGSGKSNILEALSIIFAFLYTSGLPKLPILGYHLEYEINGQDIDIVYNNMGALATDYCMISVVGFPPLTKAQFTRNAGKYLPSKVIACYSGDNTRLSDIYYPFYRDYINKIKDSDVIPSLPMLYIDRHHWKIALLVLFFYDFEAFPDIAAFCTAKLGIKVLKNIRFDINSKKIKAWNENAIIRMVMSLCRIDSIKDVPESVNLSLNDFKNNLSYLQGLESELFKYLYGATMPEEDKVITNIHLELELLNGSIISFDDLSEGEKKSLLIKFILETLADENSLILFDEPDSHIHISRKAELKEIIQRYPNRENVWTTHSPTLAMVFEENTLGIAAGTDGKTRIIEKDKHDLVSSLTDNIWNAQQQNIFLSSNKPITLLVEGKTDKIHIEEAWKHLKQNYPDLDFDVFSMNGSEHIREILIGLSCSEVKWDKKYIGLFDNDSAGKRDIGNGFEKDGESSEIKHVKYKDGKPSKCFYAFLLPKKDGFKPDEGFTIENCYSAVKYEEACAAAFREKQGHFVNMSIDRIADDLKCKSKTILAENARMFEDEDFEGFRPIFDLIKAVAYL